MNRHAAGSLQVVALDEMIARAEAACERYRRSASQPGLSPLTAKWRRDAHQAMEKALARLRAQRAAATG